MAKLPEDIQRIINSQSPKIMRNQINIIIQERFNNIKSQLIEEFLNHPVTQEIKAGPNASNTSGTLSGKGNLFSFIGFNSEDDPIQNILNILEGINISFNKEIPSGLEFFVNFPETKEIFDASPMPWSTGRSWAKGIETGISGLGYYLFKKNKQSRSGEAIQTDVSVNKIKFKNTPYISSMLLKYRKQLSNLK